MVIVATTLVAIRITLELSQHCLGEEEVTRGMVKAEDILEAHYDCIKGKSSSPDAVNFEVRLFENITELTEEINSRTYKPMPSVTFVVTRPVCREVFAANYRDRVVHHYIALRLEPLFEDVFNERTYNCRIGKGQLYGVERLASDIKECSENFTKPCWYLKCDMKGFFMSIPRRELAEKIDAFIAERYDGEDVDDLRYLSWVTVMNDPAVDSIFRGDESLIKRVPEGKSLRTSKEGCGLPIGNLTSQHDANFWLCDFDWWIEEVLDVPYHGRYVDDFYLLSQNKEKLLDDIPMIREYLENIGITLHPRKITLQSAYKGIKFTGMVVKRDRVYVGNRIVGNFRSLVLSMNKLPENYTVLQLEKYVCSINSYLGMMRHALSYDIRRNALLLMDRRFYSHLYIKGRYESVHIKRKFKGNVVLERKLRDRRLFGRLIEDCYERDWNHQGEGYKPTA